MIRLFVIFAVPCGVILYAAGAQSPLYLDDIVVLRSAGLSMGTRGLGFASFWLNDQITPLIAPALPFKLHSYYRIGNILIHILAATALFWLARELTQRITMAWAAGTLFLIHPIQTQAVTYIAQRFESQATLFMIVSAAAYARFRNTSRVRWLGIAVLAGIGAGLTKETAVMLPVWILLIEAVFYDWRLIVKRLHYLAVAGVAIAIPALQAFWGSGSTLTSVPWKNYFASQGPVLTKYLQLVVWPRDLYLYYDFPIVEAFSVNTAVQWIFILTFAAVGLFALRKSPVIGFGILTFFVLLLPVILLPLPDLVFEHRVYPAMAGLSLAIAGLLHLIPPRIAATLMVAVSIPLGYRTVQRNIEWQDPVAFMESHRDRFPNSPIILTNLSAQYANRGFVDKALEASKVARANEDRINAYYRTHVALVTAGNLGFQNLQKQNIEAARQEAELAVRLAPHDTAPLWLMSAVQVADGDFAGARQTYKKIISYELVTLKAWGGLYQTLVDLGETEKAQFVAGRIQELEKDTLQLSSDRFVLPAKYVSIMTYVMTLIILLTIVWAARTIWASLPASTSLVITSLVRRRTL